MALVAIGFLVLALTLMVAASIGDEGSPPAKECRLDEVLKSGACVIAVGGNCTNATKPCSFGASCDSDTQICACQTGYLENFKTRTCLGMFGSGCNCNNDCGGGFDCIGNKCACAYGTTYDEMTMNPIFGMVAEIVMPPITGSNGACVVNVGERCDSTKGPVCSTRNCNSENQRCACEVPNIYNKETKKCECTAKFTYEYSNYCFAYSGSMCYVSDLSNYYHCPGGGIGYHHKRDCDNPFTADV